MKPRAQNMTVDNVTGSGEKPARAEALSHPWQRPLMVQKDESLASGYILPSDYWQDLIAPMPHKRRKRPLPSSQIISSGILMSTPSSDDTNFTSPFLRDFYTSIGVRDPSDDVERKNQKKEEEEKDLEEENRIIGDEDANVEANLEDIDKTSLSTLTRAQHQFYTSQLQKTQRWTRKEKLQMKEIRELMQSEQSSYQDALRQFWRNHKEDRLTLGFSRTSTTFSSFYQWACTENLLKNDWILKTSGNPQLGQCRQMLSLRPISVNNSKLVDAGNLNIRKLEEKQNEHHLHVVGRLPPVGSQIPHPGSIHRGKSLTLCDDADALLLAEKCNADMVISSSTLDVLLSLPNDTLNSWVLPVTKKSRHIIVEEPLAQMFTSPRQCLAVALRAGLKQDLLQQSQPHKTETGKHVYFLWTLPTLPGLRRSALKVLIRSSVISLSEPNGTFLEPRVHVEYFPERGEEVLSRYERSVWILDQALDRTTQVCHVDGRNGSILKWEQVGAAHAFAVSETKEDDPMQGFVQLIQLFHGIASIDFGNDLSATFDGSNSLIQSPHLRMICRPSKTGNGNASIEDPYSVSVHACQNVFENEAGIFDLGTLLRNANGVKMDDRAIESCIRPWKWTATNRIAFTFPVHEKKQSRSGNKPVGK